MSEWREQVAALHRCRLGYDNGDKRRVEHLAKVAADPAGFLSRVEEHQLATLLHRYRQQIARQAPEASEGAGAVADETPGTEGSLSWGPPRAEGCPSSSEGAFERLLENAQAAIDQVALEVIREGQD